MKHYSHETLKDIDDILCFIVGSVGPYHVQYTWTNKSCSKGAEGEK